ncbi:zf-HC2 domain-containing protein [Massilia sp. erpn]|uniref:zf-HC2 domain-containing protein n=1 Tax=Massilia sp. erpn TaxID=2738142 RepID=UPI002103DA90|nr:zf-HC2 domain-containing protein [Massilia sp. erpn]UTY59250.1 zf-HC2 domain-containing protein [Massilia sp. erpn]
MTSRIVTLDIPAHQALQELLPWYVNGLLGAQDNARLRLHLLDCAACRAQADWERRLHQAAQEAPIPPLPDMEQALTRLLARLPETTQAPPPAPAPQSGRGAGRGWTRAMAAWLRRWPAPGRWAYVLIAVQAVLILALWMPSPAPAPGYHALGMATAQANAVILFHPATPERELRRLLRAHGARLSGGPTVTGAYLLQLPAEARQATLLALRAEAAVERAEALDSGAIGETP